MKGKKKEKRYFCDYFERWLKQHMFIYFSPAILGVCFAGIFTIWYGNSKESEKEMKYIEMLARYFYVWLIGAIVIALLIMSLVIIAASMSEKHKERDEAQKEKNKTGFEQ